MTGAEPLTGFEAILEGIVRRVVREELATAKNGAGSPLLTAEELAEALGLKNGDGETTVSWVYEQSRLGKIPTHRLGKYIRFDLKEVLESLKKNGGAS